VINLRHQKIIFLLLMAVYIISVSSCRKKMNEQTRNYIGLWWSTTSQCCDVITITEDSKATFWGAGYAKACGEREWGV
jgi:hypothetical protein